MAALEQGVVPQLLWPATVDMTLGQVTRYLQLAQVRAEILSCFKVC